jgi:hypothetical protein
MHVHLEEGADYCIDNAVVWLKFDLTDPYSTRTTTPYVRKLPHRIGLPANASGEG